MQKKAQQNTPKVNGNPTMPHKVLDSLLTGLTGSSVGGMTTALPIIHMPAVLTTKLLSI